MAVVQVTCVQCRKTEGVVKNGKATSGHQRYLCRNSKKNFQLDYRYNANPLGTHERIVDMTMNGSGVRGIGRVLKISPTTVISHLKTFALHGNTASL